MHLGKFVVILIFLCSCQGEQQVDYWQKPEEAASSSTPAANPESIQEKATEKPSQPLQLTGRDFIGERYTTSSLIAPTVLSLKNFGAVSTDVEIDHLTTEISVLLKTRAEEELFPMVTMTVSTIEDKPNVITIFKNEPIHSSLSVEKKLELTPGKYRVSIVYPMASDPAQRPPVDIHSVIFN